MEKLYINNNYINITTVPGTTGFKSLEDNSSLSRKRLLERDTAHTLQVEHAVEDANGLFDPAYLKLHYRLAHELGVNVYRRLAATARQEGKYPKRYFVWLLNREMSRA
jgi:hypothetical protein